SRRPSAARLRPLREIGMTMLCRAPGASRTFRASRPQTALMDLMRGRDGWKGEEPRMTDRRISNERRKEAFMKSSRTARTIVGIGLLIAGLALVGPALVGPAHAKITGVNWFPIGPAPSCCFFPGGEDGRATVVAMNPYNQFDVWLGTAGGGVWHST